MPQLILILLKINLVLLLFAAGYYLVLRRLTFYTLNRIFLVLGIVFSSVYPFIDLTELFYQQQNLNPELERIVPALQEGMKNLVQADPMSLFWDAMIVLFWTGTAVMAFRLAMQFFSLYRIHRKSTPGAVKGYPVRMLTDELSPFSFWQTIYINPELHPREELKTILEHEHIHVKQWHTLDIILAELSLVFYWFNPGVWLMKKAVRENIEFITDARILRKGIDRKEYQYSLLDVGRMTASPALVNNFNLSDLKKRIMMMNSRRSSPVKVYRYLLLPMTVRIIMPPLTSEALNLIKNSSVAFTIGLLEITGAARSMQEFSFQIFESFTAACTVVRMDRGLHFLQRQRLIRPSSEKRFERVGRLEPALRDIHFERTEPADIERGLQRGLAFDEVLQDGAGLILPTPSPDSGAHDTDQRRRMERLFDECHIAEKLHQPRGFRITLRPADLIRQQHDGEVGPRRLFGQPFDQRLQIHGLDRRAGYHSHAGAAFDLTHQRGEIGTDIRIKACRANLFGGVISIAPIGREYHCTLGGRTGLHRRYPCNGYTCTARRMNLPEAAKDGSTCPEIVGTSSNPQRF